MKQNNNLKFHFLESIRRPGIYRQLFPDELEGEVIIALYERLKTGRYKGNFFNEEEIHSLFAAFQKRKERGENYYQKSRNKDRIKKLLRFFLSYDEEKRLYSFQQYAYAFCELLKKTLKGALSPTEIEIICQDLRASLKDAIKNKDEALLNWFEINFEVYQTRLAQQTDFLHQQIDVAVRQLRKDALDQDKEPLVLLKMVRDDLKDIQTKNQELRFAFEDTNKIVSLLIGIDTENETIIAHISNCQAFFSRIHDKLRSTDKRLDRIQPKIKQLFAIFRQSEWTANTERFIMFLLQQSEVKGSGNNKKVQFPIEVNPFYFRSKRSNLLTFKRDETLFPPLAHPRKSYPVDETFQKESEKSLRNEIERINKVDEWIKQFMKQLENERQLDASQSFFEVLKVDEDFRLATQVLFGLTDLAYREPEYDIRISKDEMISFTPSKNRLWKMMIKKI